MAFRTPRAVPRLPAIRSLSGMVPERRNLLQVMARPRIAGGQ
jgi:hypothetical protein